MHLSVVFVAAALALSSSCIAAGVYVQTFSGSNKAIVGDGYQGFKLVNNVSGKTPLHGQRCKESVLISFLEAMRACDATQGCVFINSVF